MARTPRWVREGWPDPSPEVRSICEWVGRIKLPERPPQVQRVRLKVKVSRKAADWPGIYDYRYLEVRGYGGELVVRFRLPSDGEDEIRWEWSYRVKREDLEAYKRQWELIELAGRVADAYEHFVGLLEELRGLCAQTPKDKVELPRERHWL